MTLFMTFFGGSFSEVILTMGENAAFFTFWQKWVKMGSQKWSKTWFSSRARAEITTQNTRNLFWHRGFSFGPEKMVPNPSLNFSVFGQKLTVFDQKRGHFWGNTSLLGSTPKGVKKEGSREAVGSAL